MAFTPSKDQRRRDREQRKRDKRLARENARIEKLETERAATKAAEEAARKAAEEEAEIARVREAEEAAAAADAREAGGAESLSTREVPGCVQAGVPSISVHRDGGQRYPRASVLVCPSDASIAGVLFGDSFAIPGLPRALEGMAGG